MSEPDLGIMEALTLEEYEALPEEEFYRTELVRGRLVREPRPAFRHSWLASKLELRINVFAEDQGLGFAVNDTGFVLSEDLPTVRIPDLAFISASRLESEGIRPTGFWRGAPDLVVEIVSPSNKAAEIQEKVIEYLDAGARLVWVVDPGTRSVTVYRSPGDIRLLREGDMLDGVDVIPGFAYALSDLFAPYQPRRS